MRKRLSSAGRTMTAVTAALMTLGSPAIGGEQARFHLPSAPVVGNPEGEKQILIDPAITPEMVPGVLSPMSPGSHIGADASDPELGCMLPDDSKCELWASA